MHKKHKQSTELPIVREAPQNTMQFRGIRPLV